MDTRTPKLVDFGLSLPLGAITRVFILEEELAIARRHHTEDARMLADCMLEHQAATEALDCLAMHHGMVLEEYSGLIRQTDSNEVKRLLRQEITAADLDCERAKAKCEMTSNMVLSALDKFSRTETRLETCRAAHNMADLAYWMSLSDPAFYDLLATESAAAD